MYVTFKVNVLFNNHVDCSFISSLFKSSFYVLKFLIALNLMLLSHILKIQSRHWICIAIPIFDFILAFKESLFRFRTLSSLLECSSMAREDSINGT